MFSKILTFPKNLICGFLFLISIGVSAQVDSFYVQDLAFKFQVPVGWHTTSFASGFCYDDKSNVRIEMPLNCKRCSGTLTLSISKITVEEREARLKQNDENDGLEISSTSFEKRYGYYNTGGGFYDGKVAKDSIFYTNKRGDFIISKTPKKAKGLVEIHKYYRWSYYPINDSLEIIIFFGGLIPHDEESAADGAMLRFIDYFYSQNIPSIDSLRERSKRPVVLPDPLPLDSVVVLKTQLKYPLIEGWKYSTAPSHDSVSYRILNAYSADTNACNKAILNVSYRITAIEPNKEPQITYNNDLINLAKVMRPELLDERRRSTKSDSAFYKAKHHYYFTQQSEAEGSKFCIEISEYTEIVNVFIYTSMNERIKLTIRFLYVGDSSDITGKHRENFEKFVYFFVTSNDFEQFYLNNKSTN